MSVRESEGIIVHLPQPRERALQALPPTLTPGPVYQIYAGLGNDDAVPSWPELDAVYLPAAGEPQMVRVEADGPCSSRERQCLLGGPVTHVELDRKTRMLLRAGAPGEAVVNAAATALLSRYLKAASADPVHGGVLLIGICSDGTEADAPGEAVRHLAGLGYPVIPREDSP